MSEFFDMERQLQAEHERRQKELYAERLDEGFEKAEEVFEAIEEGDPVDHPSHYNTGRFETIEIIEEITKGYEDGYVAYCVGNALKYLARAPHKHDEPTEDLNKAAKYLEFALEYIEKKQAD